MESEGVILDKKMVHRGLLHGLAERGGIVKFQDFPFAIRINGTSGAYVEFQLLAIPNEAMVKTHMNKAPAKPKPVVVEKPKEPEFEIEEDDEVEL